MRGWRDRRDAVRQRKVLTVLLLRDVLGIDGASGYPLGKAIDDFGGVYVALAQLERSGIVTSWWADQPDGRPRRRCYGLTERGRAQAVQVVARWLTGESDRVTAA
jgi:DNA-binding PadR family transcriptional regulator